MTPVDHDHISERLRAYAAGELDATEHADVAAHLETCADCSLEFVGLTALREAVEEPMTGPERERVTAAVRAAIYVRPAGLAERWGRKLAPALGAAALVVIAVVGYMSFQADQSEPAATGGADESGQTEEADAATGTRDADRAGGTGKGGGAGAASKVAPAAQPQTLEMEADAAQGAPLSGAVGTIAVDARRRFSSAGFTSDLFGADALEERGLGFERTAIFNYGGDPAVAATIRRCAREAVTASPHPGLTPTYAAYFRDDDIIVIGFVWREGSADALNFELRGWRGRSCDIVSPIYRSGPL